ncbi:hypothetical protein LWI29_030991 [Acer saccharum]|uniref:Uncharacterized protein n=1 Tax=Acer saccharum TaxID=4024 RepID=A0AA39RXY2_ACESA|nr:hypothetical protein LWI29_030991 [Acer saccharum]
MDDEDPWLAPDKLYRFVFCFSLTVLFFTLASFSRYHFLQGRRLSRFAAFFGFDLCGGSSRVGALFGSNGSAVRSTIQEWGKHLAEHYRNVTYPKVPNFVLWVFAELSIVTCGIPEVLYGLFVPQLKGNGASGLAISFLGAMSHVVYLKVRKLEFFIVFLVLAFAGCFFAELGYVKLDAKEVLCGLFVPQLKGNGATGLAISFLGAMVMLHNPFLHSAFGAFQEDPETRSRHQVCNSSNTTPEDQASCKDLDLNRAKSM